VGTYRYAVANPTSRLPWFGRPGNLLRHDALLTILAMGLLLVGVQIGTTGSPAEDVLRMFLDGLIFHGCCVLLTTAIHNRQVTR
jgi:hypothetical protein